MKIEGLRMFQAMSPFSDYFGTVLDLDGPWTAELSDADSEGRMSDDTNDPLPGLSVWEGSCRVVVTDEDTDDEARAYEFSGTWRAPTRDELDRLARGLTPLRGFPFLPLDKRINIGRTFEIKREVDEFVGRFEKELTPDPGIRGQGMSPCAETSVGMTTTSPTLGASAKAG